MVSKIMSYRSLNNVSDLNFEDIEPNLFIHGRGLQPSFNSYSGHAKASTAVVLPASALVMPYLDIHTAASMTGLHAWPENLQTYTIRYASR